MYSAHCERYHDNDLLQAYFTTANRKYIAIGKTTSCLIITFVVFHSAIISSSQEKNPIIQSNQYSHHACYAAVLEMNKRSEETQTLRAGCGKTEPKIFAPPQTPFQGRAGRPKFNQLEMVTTFTPKPSLVRIDARNFELSW